MVLSNRRIYKIFLLSFSFTLSLLAQIPDDEVLFKFQYFEDNNGVFVRQPMGKIIKRLSPKLAVNAHVLVDGVTAASRQVLYLLQDTTNKKQVQEIKNIKDGTVFSVDAVTAASQKEIRLQIGGGVTYQQGNSLVTLSGTKSDENDYHSLSTAIDLKQDLFNMNSNVTFNYTRFDDDYKPLENNNDMGGSRLVNSFTLGWTQTLSSKTLGAISWGKNLSDGFLGRPYYHVLVEDTIPAITDSSSQGGVFYLESYPEERASDAIVILLRQHFQSLIKEASVEGEYRRYQDNWGLNSNTYTAEINQYFHKNIIMQLRYRYYQQVGTDFYRDRYNLHYVTAGDPQFISYLTVDPRLADFNSKLIVGKVIILIKDFLKPDIKGVFAFFPTRFDIEVQRYQRSTHPDAEVRRRRYENYDKKGLQAWLIRTGFSFNF